ncbi:hypothetical protein MT418_003363 [Batrachochytrium dendrobatidis]
MLSKSIEDCANVDDFKEAFNKKLSRDFDSYDAAQLSLSLTDGGEALQPYDPVPAQNTGDHPLLITITGVSAASPTQLVVPSSTDNTSGNFTATHSPLLSYNSNGKSLYTHRPIYTGFGIGAAHVLEEHHSKTLHCY